MRSVSDNFRKVIREGGPFYAYAEITLADNTVLTLNSQDDFFVDGNKYDESLGDSFPIGVAACKTIDIGINNSDDTYSVHDFDGARIVLYTEIIIDSQTTERLQEGIFDVITAKAAGDIIEISASDFMHWADIPFSTGRTYPLTLSELANEVCSLCGLTLTTVNFNNRSFEAQTPVADVTCRQMLGYIAQIAGGNAMISPTGGLVIKSYNRTRQAEYDIVSAGRFGDNLSNYISGGQFGDNQSTDIINGGSFATAMDYLILSDYPEDPNIATDDVIVTGLSCDIESDGETQTISTGTSDYMVKLENPLLQESVSGHTLTGLRLIGAFVIGVKVRPFSGSFSPNPIIELMDDVYVVDRKGNVYQSFITTHSFNYLGESEIANDIPSKEENSSVYSSNSATVQRINTRVQQETNSREAAVNQLQREINTASGLYETQEVQPDQSIIYYFHDKSTLAESQNIIKITSQAMAISTDGGQTYPVGVTVDGNAIVSILSTTGINADWINTGTLTVGGDNNTRGQIEVLNSSGVSCGVWNNNGITLKNAGQIVSIDPQNTNNRLRILNSLIQVFSSNGSILELGRDSMSAARGGRLSPANSDYVGLGPKNSTHGNPLVLAVNNSFSASGQFYDANTLYLDNVVIKNLKSIEYIDNGTLAPDTPYSGTVSLSNVTGFIIKDGLIIDVI